MSVNLSQPFSKSAWAVTGPRDLTFRWRYQKWGVTDYQQLVQGVNDVAKTPTFVGYIVTVYSSPSPNVPLVQRRTDRFYGNPDASTVETYVYTQAMNITDAGSFMPFVQVRVQVQDGSYVAPLS